MVTSVPNSTLTDATKLDRRDQKPFEYPKKLDLNPTVFYAQPAP